MNSLSLFPAIVLASIFSTESLAQKDRTLWSVPAFQHKVFIENRGQHSHIIPTGEPVLFTIDNSNEYIFFTAHGMHLVHPQYYYEGDKPTPLHPQPDGYIKEDVRLTWKVVTMNWANSNPEVDVHALDQAAETFAFGQADGPSIQTVGFSEIVYENLYPGIDVHYTFHHNTGLKYFITVDAGADCSQVEMVYQGCESVVKDLAGNVFISTIKGHIVDHSPVTYYTADGRSIESSFEVNGNSVKFSLGEYDNSNAIVIDPWVTTPGFVNADVATDIERNETTGDIYAFGGTPAHQIRKFDSGGNPQWTYTVVMQAFGNYYGDIDLGPDGNLYYSDGCCSAATYKLNESTQDIMWTYVGMGEPWRIEYNETTDRLVLAGYGFNIAQQNVDLVNTTNGTNAGMASIASNNGLEMEEIRTITIGSDGKLYSLHCSPYLALTPQTNRISCASVTLATDWQQPSNFLLPEEGAHYAYCNDQSYCADYQCFHGINGITTSETFVYSCDGDALIKRNIADGTLVTSVDVNGGQAQECSGLVVDSCSYVYVGTLEGVNQYDADLNILNTIPTAGAVFDLVPGVPGEIIACGNGFVASLAADCGLFASTQQINPDCFGDCTGSSTVEIFGGEEPFGILWSTGAETATVSNLCAGNYTVTVTDANDEVVQLEVVITSPTEISSAASSVMPACFGGCDGSATVSVSGGTAPYAYTWNTEPIQNTSTASNLCTGNYQCTITDSNGCTHEEEINVDQPGAMNVNTSIETCTDDLPNGTATATVNGGTAPFSYLWNTDPPQNTVTAINLYTGVYSVIVSDVNDCIDSALATIPICYDTLFIPNIFTPNADNDNDQWIIYNRGYTDFQCQIFNRWGNPIYEWTNGDQGWNGKTSSGDLASDGVYYYIFSATHYKGNHVKRQGYFHLVGSKD